jgi:hypothetical protein
MIKLERTANWYRPYTVVASGTTYTLESIKFYNENGEIVATSSGWLQNQCGNDIPCVELNADKITRRNKEKFDGEVFGTVCHCSYSSEKRLNLYIPMSLVNLTYVGKKKMFGDRVYACYTGDQGIYVTTFVQALDKKLSNIKSGYSYLLEEVDSYHMEKNPDETIAKLKEMIETIEEYKKERANIDSVIVED